MMRKKGVCLIVICVVAALLIAGPVLQAGMVADWLAQKTETSPGYFEGQKRGYYTAGSFSARWPQGSDYAMTVTLPKAKAGCGGIDMFMGGFSFLNVDYLVQKFQRMVQAAPAVAFNIALSVLTEKLTNEIKDLEKIANGLNNMQLDECKASKALMATIIPPALQDKKGTLANAVSDFKQSVGYEELWKNVQNSFRSKKGTIQGNEMGDPAVGGTSGCAQDIKDVFGTTGSMIDKVSAKFGTTAQTDIIRGFMGDIYIQNYGNGIIQVAYKSSCEQNPKGDQVSIAKGDIYAMNSDWQCYKTTDTKLVDWTTAKIKKIAQKVKTRGGLDIEDEAFLDSSPIPVASAMKYALGTNQEGAVLGVLADINAKAYAYAISLEFYNKVITVMEKTRQLYTANKDAKEDSEPHQCQVEILFDAPVLADQMERNAYNHALSVRQSYVALTSEINSVMALTDKLQKFDTIAQKYLSGKFGSGVARRAVGR